MRSTVRVSPRLFLFNRTLRVLGLRGALKERVDAVRAVEMVVLQGTVVLVVSELDLVSELDRKTRCPNFSFPIN